jgi:hypothetical protein
MRYRYNVGLTVVLLVLTVNTAAGFESSESNSRASGDLTPGGIDCSKVSYSGEGISKSPFLIDNIEKLQCIGYNNVSAHYRLTKDIDASETKNWQNGKGFKPIPDSQNVGSWHQVSFRGSLNGANHTIENLHIKRPQDRGAGFFGTVEKAEINNLKLKNIDIEGDYLVGGVTGVSYSSNITNIQISGSIKGGSEGEAVVGAVAGLASRNEGFKETSYGSVRRVINSISYIGRIKSNATVSGNSVVGGLVGENEGVLYESSFSGEVSATSELGGLVGRNKGTTIRSEAGTIKNSYSNATIQAEGDYLIGGIAGKNSAGKIRNVFSTSNFDFNTADSYRVGAITGSRFQSGTSSYKYWNKEETDLSQENSQGYALNTEEMKTEMTFSSNKWYNKDGEYPEIKFFSKDSRKVRDKIRRTEDREANKKCIENGKYCVKQDKSPQVVKTFNKSPEDKSENKKINNSQKSSSSGNRHTPLTNILNTIQALIK